MKEVENEFLPARYHLEIYPSSFANDPIHSAKSKSPFPVPCVGDHIDARLFANRDLKSRRLEVTDVEHLYWTIQNSHVSHKLMIAVTETAED